MTAEEFLKEKYSDFERLEKATNIPPPLSIDEWLENLGQIVQWMEEYAQIKMKEQEENDKGYRIKGVEFIPILINTKE